MGDDDGDLLVSLVPRPINAHPVGLASPPPAVHPLTTTDLAEWEASYHESLSPAAPTGHSPVAGYRRRLVPSGPAPERWFASPAVHAGRQAEGARQTRLAERGQQLIDQMMVRALRFRTPQGRAWALDQIVDLLVSANVEAADDEQPATPGPPGRLNVVGESGDVGRYVRPVGRVWAAGLPRMTG